MTESLTILIFNGTGLLISVAAIAVSVNIFGKVEGRLKARYHALIKGFGVIGLSFLWTFVFENIASPSRITNVQTIILSFGMAMLIYSANKLFDLYQESKHQKR